MAQPPSYNRGYDFSSFQTNNPDEALPATQLESEFDAIKTTIDAILVNLATLQRDDTALANQIVTPETFSQDALVLAKVSGFGIRGSWAAGTVYAINDIVNYNSATYIAVAAHTASAAFGSDSGHWVLLANAAIDTTSSAVDQFVGTGSQTQFTTSYTYNGNTDVLVFVDGQLQTPVDDYSVSGTTVTFTSAPAAPAITGRENVIIWGPSVPTNNAVASATTQASNAAASATTAAGHVSSAQAAQSASETARDDSQTARDASQTAQSASESARDTAQDHRNDAQKLATNAEDSQFTLADGTTTGYSALHHKEKALDAQTASESARDTSLAHSNTASGHAADALSHSNTASGHVTTALGHSNTAQGHANTAQTQAGLAAASATSASGYADTAEDEKDLAVVARQAAESARDATLTAYDNFDDRYLGAKTGDPTTDNDGNSLVAGTLYFDQTNSIMKIYTGSSWVAAYADGSTLVAKSGDTMTGNLTVNANINANSLNVDGSITSDGMTIDGGDVTVNGQYSDNVFMVDYSSGRVGINLGAGNTPQSSFHVKGGQRWEETTNGNILDLQHYSAYSFLYRSNGALRLSGQGAASTNYLELNNSGGFTYAGNNVWHAGNLDSILDLGITDGSNGQALKTDGSGNLSFGDTAWADITGKPTTISGFGITDAFDGAYSSLTGAPTIPTNNNQLTNGAGYITSADGGNATTLDGIDSSQFLRSDASDTMTGDLDINNGSSSTLSVRASGTGMAKIWARGSSQATGMVMVSQDDNHGGGIEYNGDSNPVSTGAGNDYIALFRVDSGTYSWTARNAYSNNDWQFRGNVTAYASDERLKENIETIPNALDKVCQLRGVTFDWKDDCEDKGFMPTMKHETGVLAQNVRNVIPDAAVPAPFDDEYLTVKHEKIIPVLIEAIKELKAEIEDLKKG